MFLGIFIFLVVGLKCFFYQLLVVFKISFRRVVFLVLFVFMIVMSLLGFILKLRFLRMGFWMMWCLMLNVFRSFFILFGRFFMLSLFLKILFIFLNIIGLLRGLIFLQFGCQSFLFFGVYGFFLRKCFMYFFVFLVRGQKRMGFLFVVFQRNLKFIFLKNGLQWVIWVMVFIMCFFFFIFGILCLVIYLSVVLMFS